MLRDNLRITFISEGALGTSYQVTHPSYHKFFPQRDLYLSRELCKLAIVNSVLVSVRQQLSIKAKHALAEADVLIFHNPEIGLILSEAISKPAIFDCIDWYEELVREEFEGDLTRMDRMAEAMKVSCDIADAITCQSPVLLHWLADRFHISHKPLSIVPNGYDDALFRPTTEREKKTLRAELRQHWPGLARFRYWLIYQGKLGRWYSGLQACLEDVEELADTALICVGDGPLREHLESLGLTSTIFVGAIAAEEVPRFTRACDAAVFPVDDCSPIVVGEYLGCGLPVIAKGSRVGWLIRESENGCLVSGERGSWAQGIQSTLNKWRSEKERSSIAAKAKGLTWRAQAAKLLGAVECLLLQSD